MSRGIRRVLGATAIATVAFAWGAAIRVVVVETHDDLLPWGATHARDMPIFWLYAVVPAILGFVIGYWQLRRRAGDPEEGPRG